MSPSKCDYSADIEHGRRRFFKRRNLMCYSWAASDNKSIDARVCVSRQWKINRAFGYIWFVQSARIVGLNVCARHCDIIRIVTQEQWNQKCKFIQIVETLSNRSSTWNFREAWQVMRFICSRDLDMFYLSGSVFVLRTWDVFSVNLLHQFIFVVQRWVNQTNGDWFDSLIQVCPAHSASRTNQ